MIEIVGSELNQWDVGRCVKITGIEAEYAHFANKGDSKAVIMGIVDIDAKIPDFLLQSGKQLCVYAVKDGITLESKTFYVKHRERPENYVYEDDQRNYIYELINKAETVIEGASAAFEDAALAVDAANTAVASANIAVENANKSANSASEAAGSANLAAKTATEAAAEATHIANEAAAKAEHTAKSLMVVGSAEGNSIHLDDAIDQFVVGLRIFGKTTQDGTPTPDAPVDLVSVENPTVTVNDQTLPVPYTLHGVPVKSGGNYTDAYGQMWYSDEIDLERGVYVQRCCVETVVFSHDATNNRYIGEVSKKANIKLSEGIGIFVLCDKLPFNGNAGKTGTQTNGIRISNANNTSVIAYYNGEVISSQNVLYPLEKPTEVPLLKEELAAFAALRTYRGNTTVSNNASAHMEIEYVMDAKKYIDSHISPAARISSVSLPASKWSGSGSLYSQVVSIAGVTENSQVNLAPSVEQMATFYEKDITFITENDGGVVTVYVIGQKPQNDYTIQADIVEVIA